VEGRLPPEIAAAIAAAPRSHFQLDLAGARYFIKTADASRVAMFEAEAAGIEAIAATKCVRVPGVVAVGTSGTSACIVLEHVTLGRRDSKVDALLGRQLAALHRVTNDRFGWNRDNTIGPTPQNNTWSPDWSAFWRDARLKPQLDLARANGYGGRLQAEGEKLLARVPDFLGSYAPAPSLLHGDLWSGNAAADETGAPVIFDPAVYYGDREADLAMTELFGGFAAEFYAAYDEAWPLEPGYDTRRDLYSLYHVLNHLNLFGGAYLAQAERLIAKLLR
jgi:fructosamine-3-kinase